MQDTKLGPAMTSLMSVMKPVEKVDEKENELNFRDAKWSLWFSAWKKQPKVLFLNQKYVSR